MDEIAFISAITKLRREDQYLEEENVVLWFSLVLCFLPPSVRREVK